MDKNVKSVPPNDLPEKVKDKVTKLLMECGCNENGRCLVNTNVIELYYLIRKEEEDNQLTWYNSGIGTYARPSWKSFDYYKQVIGHKIDLAIAWNFEKTILGAYRWLSDNYKKGDRIFLFGFSRGAFQVRALSGMIHKVGLIHKGNELQIPFAYELYADPRSDEKTVREVGESGKVVMTSMAERFKRAFSRGDVKVHFVGAWDTVSSIGITRGKKLLPHTVDGMKHVCYFRHALALDERRVKFLPEYAYGGSTLGTQGREEMERHSNDTKQGTGLQNAEESLDKSSVFDLNSSSMNSRIDDEATKTTDSRTDVGASKTLHSDLKTEQTSVRRRQQVKEVWFAGTHSDIGGGNVANAAMDRSRPSLRWMVFEAGAAGLRTKGFKGELSSKDLIEVRESLTWFWRPFEFLPFPRLTFSRRKGSYHSTVKPHLGAGRKIHPGQKIHASLILANRDRYTPKARPPEYLTGFWEKVGPNVMRDWLEFDVYDEIDEAMSKFLAEEDDAAAGDGLKNLDNTRISVAKKYRLLVAVLDILQKPHVGEFALKLAAFAVVRHCLAQLKQTEGYDLEKLNAFVSDYTERCIMVIDAHDGGVYSISYSIDGQHIVSGSSDKTTRIWNAQTGEAESPVFRGPTERVNSVAFSPKGKVIASGSYDKSIRLWDVKTSKQIWATHEGHGNWIQSVAFSPDGSLIASDSDDGAVQLWDAATGEAVGSQMKGHSDIVLSVAFSPDGKTIASGARDDTVRLWDVETGLQVGEPLRTHAGGVYSVAFSPDGKRLVSGSYDETVLLWNLETGKVDGRPLQGHTNTVCSVAFSLDGKRVVSGSWDKTVRLWNVETREAERPPLKRHESSVLSVAFSPDGKRVASGSLNGTIRIWDILENNSRSQQPSENLRERIEAEVTRLLMECGCDANGRCLVVCIDGTSNQFGEKNTNVIELYYLIRKEEEDNQLTWYNSGIGTYARPSWKSVDYYKQVIGHKVDLAIAWNFEKTILGAYRWLSDNYLSGDRIFLFGFSRGAFQVRALSGMIHKVGLIHRGNELQIPFAYELYADPKSDEKTVREVGESGKVVMTSMAERFKKAFSRDHVKVHFVGVWDTVSSIGVTRGKKLLPYTIDGMKHVCYFRHALALDERRVKFLPEYAYGSSTLGPSGKEGPEIEVAQTRAFLQNEQDLGKAFTVDFTSGEEALEAMAKDTKSVEDTKTVRTSRPLRKRVKEVWFAGTHSDIGGGNVANATMDRSRPSLRWMVFEAEAVGLKTKGFRGELSSKDLIEVRESLTWAWLPFEIIPFPRLTFSREKCANHSTIKPHLGAGRKIHPGQKVHASLILANRELAQSSPGHTNQLGARLSRLLRSMNPQKRQNRYTPRARPPEPSADFWETIASDSMRDWLEFDVYDEVDDAVAKFLGKGYDSASVLKSLHNAGASGAGRQPLYDKLIAILTDEDGTVTADQKYQLLSVAVDILQNPHSRGSLSKLANPRDLRLYADALNQDAKYDSGKIKSFIRDFTESCLVLIEGDGNTIWSVAYSNSGQHLVSGSSDNSIRFWDADTGAAVGHKLQGHTGHVRSATFSPDDSQVVSGSDDRTIRTWDVKTGKQIGKLLDGHSGRGMSVAFSQDGLRIASGSGDNTVRLWDRATGEALVSPMEGHTLPVTSVVFSPDCECIASGSQDGTVILWDVKTGRPVGKPFRGHTGGVSSVAFSCDGRYIVSGSSDETVRLWNVDTQEQDGRPFRGHTDVVSCVSFSPDGRLIASGSWDETVRLWDVGTRDTAGPLLKGHTDRVQSVSFSPNGRCVASGSKDGTIRIWDVAI
ncbi:hypothetical protein CVT26_013291 [Gymnopilus dilepis]|uniref:DUF2235 domain-containing protein n=1 Tax=Gymnopilus dilepis TaxID=231916 RepID=A0A409VUM6_9AGAR|nr:hypothetical protein CVT26_013291 [Gymnopilus dilepis]